MNKIMRAIIFLIIGTLLTGCGGMLGMAGLTSFKNEPDGFRDIRWGQKPDDTSRLKLVESDQDGLKIYVRYDDPMELGDAKLYSIQYLFWKDQFLEAQIQTSPNQLQALKNVLFEKYGRGEKLAPYIEEYLWAGPTAIVGLKLNLINSRCEVWLKSRDINDVRTIFLSQKAKSGAERGALKDF